MQCSVQGPIGPVGRSATPAACSCSSTNAALIQRPYRLNVRPAPFHSHQGKALLLPVPIRQGFSTCLPHGSSRQKVVTGAFFGVGAPEAIVIGMVALIVFGPKGLAEAAKSLGKTLRSFQPAIREITEVSSELQGTIAKELGLDEVRGAARPGVRPAPAPAPKPSRSQVLAKMSVAELEAELTRAKAAEQAEFDRRMKEIKDEEAVKNGKQQDPSTTSSNVQ